MVLKRNVRGGVPSPYPRFLFHGLRSAQLIASITVGGIMAYFMYYMRLEHISIPWTFILLLTVSLATVGALVITIVFYNFTYLSPRFNLVLNGSISLLWGLGLGLLSWSISTSNVLAKQCTRSVWGGEAKASVCRYYKALWAMTLVGTVSTLAALTLDITTQNKVNRRGVYNLPEDEKDAQRRRDLRAIRIRSVGYDLPVDNGGLGGSMIWMSEHEQDIGYHNRYGAEDMDQAVPSLSGPLGAHAERELELTCHGDEFRD